MSGGCCCVAVILSVCVGLAILVVAVCFGLRLVEKPTSPNDSPKVPLVGASTPMSTTSYKTTSATTTISTTVNPLTTPSGQEDYSGPIEPKMFACPGCEMMRSIGGP
ncbi:hypothetical protein Bbelb_369280 [Branchiostoma belcheri]|nr:hypothetical protein Bbelb_369280 [Branchiostoma belcheri]